MTDIEAPRGGGGWGLGESRWESDGWVAQYEKTSSKNKG